MNKISLAAQTLGRMAKGKKKRLTKAEIKRRTERLLANRYDPNKKY